MKKLFLILLTIVSFTSFGQYTPTEDTFSKTYTQIRMWEKSDSIWVYSDGSFIEWTFHFNVNFSSSPGYNMFGVIMEDEEGIPNFFFNYLGNIHEDEDEYGEYGSYQVDILTNNQETKTWEYWNSGELRYYGPWTYLFIRENVYFSYFREKLN